jgi:hypothetical protein
MSNLTNRRLRSMVIGIAAGILVMTLGAPAFAASHSAQFVEGSAAMNASGGQLPAAALSNGRGQENNNGKANGHQRLLDLPRDFFHFSLGSVSDVLRGISITTQTTTVTTVGLTSMTAYDPHE